MLKFRLIARLDVRNGDMISRIRFEGVRKFGDPAKFAARYNDEGIDEIVYLDAVASLYGRNALAGLLDRATESVFAPITAGGGVRCIEDAQALLRMGADKVAVNTAAVRRPDLITELSAKFGAQAVVAQIDARRKNGGWEAYCDGGREPTGRDALRWAKLAHDLGAGEILVTSIDQEGTGRGCDLRLVEKAACLVSCPVVASGGVGSPDHIVAVAQAGASGIAVARALHYKYLSLQAIRQALDKAGVPVRMVG